MEIGKIITRKKTKKIFRLYWNYEISFIVSYEKFQKFAVFIIIYYDLLDFRGPFSELCHSMKSIKKRKF
jgi:hypothetical protein